MNGAEIHETSSVVDPDSLAPRACPTARKDNATTSGRGSASRTPLWTLCGLLLFVNIVGQLTAPTQHLLIDQIAWHEEARSILLNGSLATDDGAGSARWAFVKNPRDNHYYSKYGVVNGLMHVPPLAIELAIDGSLPHEKDPVHAISLSNPRRVAILNVFFVALSLGIASLLWLVTGCYSKSVWMRAYFVLITLYCTTLWHYLRFPLSESTQVGLFLLFWLFFLRFGRRAEPPASRPKRDVYWAWFALLLLCQTRVADLFILPLFGLYLAWLAWESELPWRRKAAFLFWTAIVPAALIVAAQGFVHFVKFGSPFLSGYHQYWEKPVPHSVWQVLYEFTLHPQWSCFITFPVLILALPGWWPYMRRYTAEAVLLLSILYGMFAIVEPLPFWRGEFAYGPRYFLYLLPVLSLPALYVLEWLAAWRRSGFQPDNRQARNPTHNRLGEGDSPQFCSADQPSVGARAKMGTVPGGLIRAFKSLTYRFRWVRPALLAGVVVASLFLAVAQFQVQRFGFFDWRGAFRNPAGGQPEVREYFNFTSVPRICWDHIRCRDHLEGLPYYEAMSRDKTPEEVEAWKRELLSHINYSNLYWFPDINR